MSFSAAGLWGTNLFRHIKIHHQTINTVLMFGLRLQKILPLPAGPNWMKPTGTSAACLVSVRRSVSNPWRSSAVSGKLDVGTSDWPGERDDGWAGAAVPVARLGCQTPSQSELRSPNRSGSQFTRGGIHRRSAPLSKLLFTPSSAAPR